jgi:hypothetical protein
MAMRKCLLGLGLVLGMANVAGATPPVSPMVEGREPNPVAREFYETESVSFGYVAEAAPDAIGAGWWASRASWETLLNKLTMPLGTVELWD